MTSLLDEITATRHSSNGDRPEPEGAETYADGTPVVRAPIRLNLGAGDIPIEGYIPIDRKTGHELYPLDYPDASVDCVRCSHALEHLPRAEVLPALTEWARVLKPGGSMRLAVPDLDVILRMHAAGQRGVEPYLMGGQVDADDFHKTVWTENKLRMLMRGVGLRRVRRWKSEVQDCAALPVSLNLEGFKPEPIDVQKVRGVMSVPRYVQSTAMACIFDAIHELGIPVKLAGGPYWHQAQEVLFEQAIAAGAEYILSIDSDTTFTPDDVRELYRLISTNPHVDAIAPIQMARGMPGPLLTIADPENPDKPLANIPAEWFEKDLLECRSAHFGCTVLRCASFAKLKKPWFMPQPDPEGGWGEKRVDADVGAWLKWREAGNTLFVAPLVSIGHVEEIVLSASRQMTHVVQDVGEFRREGPPIESIR